MKRFLECVSSDFLKMTNSDIIESIKKSEGRVLACEVITNIQSVLLNISNAELACAFGADIIILNMFDVQNPHI